MTSNNISLEKTENGYFAISNERFFKINELTYKILQLKISGETTNDISKEFGVSSDEIDKVLTVFDSKSKINKISKLCLFIPSTINNIIGRSLVFICHKYLIIIFLIGFLLASIHFFMYNNFSLLYANVGIIEYLIALFAVVILHEYGHIVTAYYRHLTNLNIYVGFFLIFPTLYVNINDLVTKKFKNRLLVDFGGIYFQIVSFLIVYVLDIFFNSDYIKLFLSINFFVMIVNIIPFYFTDGYWLYADFFEVENLNKKSSALLKKTFCFDFKNEHIKHPVVRFYAIFKLLIFTILAFYITTFLYSQSFYIEDTYYQVIESKGNISTIFRFIFLLFPFVLISILIFKKIHYGITKYIGRNSK
jgi:putative peptide zinc metalloprotease protein